MIASRVGLLRRCALVLALTVLVSDAWPLHAEWRGARIVSSTVVAMLKSRDESDDIHHLDLLVLWRGSPGWFMRGSAGSTGGTRIGGGVEGGTVGGLAGAGGVISPRRRTEWITWSYGTLTLRVDLDLDTNVATILGTPVPLANNNVVIVDNADSSAGSKVADTRWIEPTISGSGDLAVLLIQQRPELYDFLHCEVGLPHSTPQLDAIMKPLVGPICDAAR